MKVTFVAFALALPALVAGCATTYEPYPSAYPAASVPTYPVVVAPEPNTDAPRIENSDAAGVVSVPGYRSPDIIVVPQAPFVAPPAR